MTNSRNALRLALLSAGLFLAVSGCHRNEGPGSPGWPRVTPDEARAAYSQHLKSLEQSGAPPGGRPGQPKGAPRNPAAPGN